MKFKALFYFAITLALSISCLAVKASDKPTAGGIYSLETIDLGGVKQTILITSKDISKPILLFVHGGPGFSEMALIRKYNSDLDKHFIVVNWDQRGTNLSYHADIPKASMTMEQIVADAHELTLKLKQRFGKKKIFLMGHSWGSAVGIRLADKYPGDYYAYIGVGQAVNLLDNERIAMQFATKMAQQAHNQKAIDELKSISPYPSPAFTIKQLMINRNWLNYYGGEVYKHHNADEIFKGITDGRNPLYDVKRSDAGNTLSMETLWMPLMKTDFPRTIPALKLPVYFILGEHDYNVSYELAEQYLKKLKAPEKHLILFNNSAHLIPFEEPQRFVQELAKISKTAVK